MLILGTALSVPNTRVNNRSNRLFESYVNLYVVKTDEVDLMLSDNQVDSK